MKVKLTVFQRIFSHYRKAFYDGLARKYELQLLHGRDSSGIEMASSDYSYPIGQLTFFREKVRIYFSGKIGGKGANVLVLDFAVQILLLPFYMWRARLNRTKVLLWSHGYDRKKGFNPAIRLIDRYRALLINYSDGLLVYSEEDKNYLQKRGIQRPIYVVPNTLDSDYIRSVKSSLSGCDSRLFNNPYKYNLTFIGRMVSGKQPILLLKMLEHLPETLRNATAIHFIGDGPERRKIEDALSGHPLRLQVFFHGALYDENEIGKVLLETDLVIMPGEVGLSLNHALLYDVPVVCFRKDAQGPFHGPEEAHLLDGKTGFWVEKNNLVDMAKCVEEYLCDGCKRKYMKAFVASYVEQHLTIDKMMTGFNHAIQETLKVYEN